MKKYNEAEIDKAIHKIVFNNDIVFNDEYKFFASSDAVLKRSIKNGYLFYDNLSVGNIEPSEFCRNMLRFQHYKNAWGLVEKIASKTEVYISNYYNYQGWNFAYKEDGVWVSINGNTAQEAICLAFLKFNGVDIKQFEATDEKV